MKTKQYRQRRHHGLLACGAVLMAAALPANAVNFSLRDGAIRGAFDTDVTYGLSLRTAKPSEKNLGAYGNRELYNDRWDIFSNTVSASHTLELQGSDYGVIARGNYFYDFEAANQPLPDAAENRAKSHGDITDAYVYKYFGPNDSVSVRLGKQVISWGENTFIGGALADINTVDISKLRQPGSQLKDAFLGTPAAHASWTFFDNFTLEGFYLFSYDEIKVDPAGSFFTTLDAIADGGGFDSAGDGVIDGRCLMPDGGACDLLGGALVRTGDDIPGSGGQWGMALRVFLPTLFNGSEIGFYYQNLHDHLPSISGYSGTGEFFLDYAEDIERFGLSFNTNMSGYALSGEYSYRRNAPIQMTLPLMQSARPVGPFAAYARPAIGTKIEGFERIGRHQLQMTVNRNWGVVHAIGADASATIAEVAWGWLEDLPDVDDPLAGPIPGLTTAFEPQISRDYGKLVIRHSMTYNAALFNLIALEPNFAFSWDFHGFSNELGGAKLVVEDRKAMTFGLGFLYMGGRWTGNVAWTRFFGPTDDLNNAGSRLNGTTDRDFLSLSVSHSF